MVTKVERINCMRTRLKPLFFINGQSAAKLRIGERSTTIPSDVEIHQQEYGSKRVGENPLNGSGSHPIKDEDIVYSQVKACGVEKLNRE